MTVTAPTYPFMTKAEHRTFLMENPGLREAHAAFSQLQQLPQELINHVFSGISSRKTKDLLAKVCIQFEEGRRSAVGKDGSLGNKYVRLETRKWGSELQTYLHSAPRLRAAFCNFSIQKNDGVDESCRLEDESILSAFERYRMRRLLNTVDEKVVEEKPFSLESIKKYEEIDREKKLFDGESSFYRNNEDDLTVPWSYRNINQGIGFDPVEHKNAYYVQIEHKNSNYNVTKRKMIYIVPQEDSTAICTVLTRKKVVPNVEALAGDCHTESNDICKITPAREDSFFVKFNPTGCAENEKNAIDISQSERNHALETLNSSIGKDLLEDPVEFTDFFGFYRDKPIYRTRLDRHQLEAIKKISTPIDPT